MGKIKAKDLKFLNMPYNIPFLRACLKAKHAIDNSIEELGKQSVNYRGLAEDIEKSMKLATTTTMSFKEAVQAITQFKINKTNGNKTNTI